MMDRHRIIQRAFNMRPHMVSISLAWAQRPRCASTSTRIGRPGSSTGTTRADSTATLPHPRSRILRQVVVADTDEEALETTRAANEDWYHSITKLWHDRDGHSVDGLFAWETATRHETITFGSPARVREQIDRLAKASGCNYVICALAWVPCPTRANEVMPAWVVLRWQLVEAWPDGTCCPSQKSASGLTCPAGPVASGAPTRAVPDPPDADPHRDYGSIRYSRVQYT